MKVLLVSCGDVATETGLQLHAQGHQVTAWRRDISKLPAAFVGHSVDLLEPTSWPEIDPETELVLFTPVPATRDVQGYERSYLQTARTLISRLSASCPQLPRLIYVSSSAVLGGTDGQWISETAPLQPSRPTSEILARTEQVLTESPIPTTILRASGIYGPGRTRLIDEVTSGNYSLPANSHWTNRIHRDDLAAAIIHVAHMGDRAAGLYLATDNEPSQLADVYEFLRAELGLPRTVHPHSTPSGRRVANRRLSNELLLAAGFVPRFPSYREGYRSILAGESTRHR